MTPKARPLERPRTKAKVIAMMLDGLGDAEIARTLSSTKFPITRQAVFAFRRRHEGEIAPAIEKAAAEVVDRAITDKANRLAAKDMRWQLLEQVRKARAEGKTGEETGLIVKQYKMLGSGPTAEVVTEYKLDAGWLAAALALEDSVADELGQRPKPGGDTYNDNRVTIIREIHTTLPPVPLG